MRGTTNAAVGPVATTPSRCTHRPGPTRTPHRCWTRTVGPSTSIGRFVATDPHSQGTAQSWLSDYLYVGNQSQVYTDPSGLCFGPEWACDAADQVKGAAVKAKDTVTSVASDVAKHTTDHVGGCADRDKSECGWLFTDLVSLGGIESAKDDAGGCADHDKSDLCLAVCRPSECRRWWRRPLLRSLASWS